jgi:sugar lactone lactonase YvrE
MRTDQDKQAGNLRLPDDLAFEGQDLCRPESVLVTRDGSRYCADWRGGVCHLLPDGTQRLYLPKDTGISLRPNGIALLQDGAFLLADLGALGGIWRLDRRGAVTPFLTEHEGRPLPGCNFVMLDVAGRTWVTVSTRRQPRQLAQRPDVADGFILCVDRQGVRLAADGLGYTNEVLLDPGGNWLYVNETCARRLSRFYVSGDGRLGRRETVHHFGPGDYPDGLGMDEAGGIWIVSIVSNRIYRMSPEGDIELLYEDNQDEHLDWVEDAFQNGRMTPEHFGQNPSGRFRNVSSIAFGGPGRRTAWLGSLLDERLIRFGVPHAGVKPVHWNWTFPTGGGQ